MGYWARLTVSIIAVLLMFGVEPVRAHASLLRSDPPANASLNIPPSRIQLWFTEPLEPEFSRFTVRDSNGNLVDTPSSQVDVTHTELVMEPGALANGLYTVSWRVLSTDGHSTAGSFSFGVRVEVASSTALENIEEVIPVDSALIRWLNLLSLSFAVGSVAFWLFVWNPAVPDGQLTVEKGMLLVTWLGWAFVGLTSVLMLLLQVSIAAGVPVFDALTHPALSAVLMNSRYGQLWLARMVLWLGLGGVLWLARSERWLFWMALILGGQILLTTSLYSHASAIQQETVAAVANAWLHLTATALWIGGLVQFFLVIGLVRRSFTNATITLSDLIGHFSNYARVTVAALLISGFYAAWLQVGSAEALLTTVYGRVLLAKLLLVMPLLAVSGINLLITRRRLSQGISIWGGHLRGLIGAEIAFTIGILAAVGIMTAIAPARNVLSAQAPEHVERIPQLISEMQTTEALMVHLEVTPGNVGENTFTVMLFDAQGNPITDPARIRLRFDHADQNLGQSELRPERQSDGTYVVIGANLSVPGSWRIRMTVQRTGEFDTVIDFEPDILPAPSPSARMSSNRVPMSGQWIAGALVGFVLLVIGGFTLAQYRLRSAPGPTVMSVVMLSVGVIFLGSASGIVGITASAPRELSVRNAWTLPLGQGMTSGVYLTIDNNTDDGDRLISAFTDVADAVEFHQTFVENDIVRMEPAAGFDIPAGESLLIEPGRYHLMLVNLQRDLSVGESIVVRLHFRSGTELTVEVPVQFEAES